MENCIEETQREYHVRHAIGSDAPRINEIIDYYAESELLTPHSLDYIKDYIGEYVVLERAGEIAGIGAVVRFDNDSAEIRSVAIVRQFQRMGYGTSITDFLIKEAKRLGARNIYLYTSTPQFFSTLGFREVPYGIRPDSRDKPVKVYNDADHKSKFYDVVNWLYPEYVDLPIWEGNILMEMRETLRADGVVEFDVGIMPTHCYEVELKDSNVKKVTVKYLKWTEAMRSYWLDENKRIVSQVYEDGIMSEPHLLPVFRGPFCIEDVSEFIKGFLLGEKEATLKKLVLLESAKKEGKYISRYNGGVAIPDDEIVLY